MTSDTIIRDRECIFDMLTSVDCLRGLTSSSFLNRVLLKCASSAKEGRHENGAHLASPKGPCQDCLLLVPAHTLHLYYTAFCASRHQTSRDLVLSHKYLLRSVALPRPGLVSSVI